MRRERLVAAAMVAGAVWLGVLAGCGGGGNQGGDTSNETSTPAPTPAPVESAAGGAPAGEVSLALGQKVVKERCELCHGASGKGDGPGGAALNPKPRNWTDHTLMGAKTNEDLYQVIYNGKGSMPAWGKTGILNETEIRSAILAVRTYDPQYKAPN